MDFPGLWNVYLTPRCAVLLQAHAPCSMSTVLGGPRVPLFGNILFAHFNFVIGMSTPWSCRVASLTWGHGPRVVTQHSEPLPNPMARMMWIGPSPGTGHMCPVRRPWVFYLRVQMLLKPRDVLWLFQTGQKNIFFSLLNLTLWQSYYRAGSKFCPNFLFHL